MRRMHTTAILESDALHLPASLLVPGHVTFAGVITASAGFTEADGTVMVRVEYPDGDACEYHADDDVVVIATVAPGLLAVAQDEVRC